MSTETKLHNLIEETFQELKDMHPADGLNSPRDLALVAEINKKAAVMDDLQKIMQDYFNPDYNIRS